MRSESDNFDILPSLPQFSQSQSHQEKQNQVTILLIYLLSIKRIEGNGQLRTDLRW